MKKWLAAALCTAAAMSASSALAANINFVTAGTSSTFYPISATSRACARPPRPPAVALTT